MAGLSYKGNVGLTGTRKIEDGEIFSAFEKRLKLIKAAALSNKAGSGRGGRRRSRECPFRNGEFHKNIGKKEALGETGTAAWKHMISHTCGLSRDVQNGLAAWRAGLTSSGSSRSGLCGRG